MLNSHLLTAHCTTILSFDELLKTSFNAHSPQFIDPDFPHDASSIGECWAKDSIVGWKVAGGINMSAGLFEEGTDPDDVFQGMLNDGWLLSAISILAASGGVDDDEVDPLIADLFCEASELKTDTGAYGVRLWVNAQWETVVVDDFLPVISDEYKHTK